MKLKITSPKSKKEAWVVFDRGDLQLLFGKSWCVAKRSRRCTYAVTSVNSRTIYMHQLIMGTYRTGQIIDHKNGNGLDNRRSNLRICTKAQNQRFRGPKQGKRYKGVIRDKRKLKKRFSAVLRKGKSVYRRGYFLTEVEAAAEYNAMAEKHFGDFAWLNKIPKQGSEQNKKEQDA